MCPLNEEIDALLEFSDPIAGWILKKIKINKTVLFESGSNSHKGHELLQNLVDQKLVLRKIRNKIIPVMLIRRISCSNQPIFSFP